jgi:hypothetical protein
MLSPVLQSRESEGQATTGRCQVIGRVEGEDARSGRPPVLSDNPVRRQNKGCYDGQAVRARSAKAAASTGSGLILRSNISTWSRTPCCPSCSSIRARVTG